MYIYLLQKFGPGFCLHLKKKNVDPQPHLCRQNLMLCKAIRI